VYDGTGGPGRPADAGIRGDRNVGVEAFAARGATELDATGLAGAPGFIDVSSHDDFAVLLKPEMPFEVMQGVTTDVVGSCGPGVVPYETDGLLDAVREAIRVGEEAGVPVQISHHKASGRNSWGRVRD
jgi:N-acyl-D-amino-acid deacylase